ncbi:MAG: M20 family metallopeptidase [Eubacteriaceae bacterium]
MKEILEQANKLQDELTEIRHHIHRHPELGLETVKTADFVIEKLKEMGYEPKRIGGNGVTVTVGKKPGKCFLIRGDMDALPIEEEADVDYKSEIPGRMHACGHDMHTTMLLGAAKLLKENEEQINGVVKLLFQPGEEIMNGAKSMIEAGILENPKVDGAFMFHVVSGFPVPTGNIICPEPGNRASSNDAFEIRIQGKGGHGAMPEKSVDPINVAVKVYEAIQAMQCREFPSSQDVTISLCQIEAGSAFNIIPDTAIMRGTLRAFDEGTRDHVLKRMAELADGIAKVYHASATANSTQGSPTFHVDGSVVIPVRKALEKVFGDTVVGFEQAIGVKSMPGSEDFAYIAQKTPGAFFFISSGNSEDGYKYSMHHPKVRCSDEILYRGAAAYAIAAIAWLDENN